MDVLQTKRDRPWLMRTYSGHSSAKASNTLYRTNLAKGQTGLSVAFDLPTQTGYDADSPLARGEVGKVGVPISHIEDMDQLFDQIPLDQMNTAMTINATAPWLLSLYIGLAQRRGIDPKKLSGTTQNDIIKEYLSRGTYIYPPGPSMRLIADTINYTIKHVPKWNPTNICSYHLQEAGATPVQELAYALCAAMAVLDRVQASGEIKPDEFSQVVERISFFVNAGIRFVEECCKLRAFGEMWDELTLTRYKVADPKLRRFRYGVQVNSLGLTEPQPENNVQRIVLEMLAVALSKGARARAIQLPAWNEAMGLPRPWDQQWALRMQQVLAFETDLLEYEDIFDGSPVIAAKVRQLVEGARKEIANVEAQGGIIAAIESGYVKRELVASHMNRLRAIESGELKIIGVNCFQETAESPLTLGSDGGIMKTDPAAEREQIERLQAHRKNRNDADVQAALQGLGDAARSGENIMPSSIRCALAGVSTGEWGDSLRAVFGEFRPPTGIDIAIDSCAVLGRKDQVTELRTRVASTGEALGRPLKLLVGKPGLDGHSNGAEQVAVKARDVGFEVVYDGIRLTPQQIAQAAEEEGVHMVGLSILSGSHMELVESVLDELRLRDLASVPVIAGGIIPLEDATKLVALGVSAVYTPKDFSFNTIMADMVDVIRAANGLGRLGPLP
ncbi:protein meaA [Candidatus Accumulibacter phosphatis]|jgi:(2R)-ethylmalonyl-CoA mutase|uniref:Protein meaA n=1 Tax=Candidatus Accumulibacter phosphatis TaxID=327160 RepID=A0ABX1TXU1_9PROT|nr:MULTISPECIES: protein meaA [Candidatus Accumulibacter]NMQ27498.1 protein meaA [Candidatus Accumulibacter phosphatis]